MTNENLLGELIGNAACVIVKSETGSTNTDARELIKNGLSRPTLIVADRQIGGRGRSGKSFLSPDGGLYMTLALPVGVPIDKAMCATPCAAVAVCLGIEDACGVHCGIKWINDIYVGGKKLCGILTESVNDYGTMTSQYLIIGIGVNIDSTPVITDSSVKAVSLMELGYKVSREVVCANITHRLLDVYQNGFDFSLYTKEYTSRSVLLGREISFTECGITRYGTAKRITDRGALIVECNGSEIVLDSGEVSVRINET